MLGTCRPVDFGQHQSSGVSWATDLAGSTDTTQTVVSLTGTGAAPNATVSVIANILSFAATTAAPLVKQATAASDVAPANLTFRSQAGFATATGANKTAGNLVFDIPAASNSGTGHGYISVTDATVEHMRVGLDSVGTYFQWGTTPYPATGTFRGGGGGSTVNFLAWKRADNGATAVGIAYDPSAGNTVLWLGCDPSFANGCNLMRIFPGGSGTMGTGSTTYLAWGSSTLDFSQRTRFVDTTHAAGVSGYSHLYSVSGQLFANNTGGKQQAVGSAYATKLWPSDANYTAAAAEYTATIMNFTGGSLGATRDLIVPIIVGYKWVVANNTTGANSIRVIGASGTGITIANGKSAMVYADGTNIVRATADV